MNDKVEKQYANWVYPAPIEDMRNAISTGQYLEVGDPLMYFPLMWPRKRNVEKLDILIAGCGTNQAAYYACRNPNWNVLGIDLSESSLAHQQMLKEKHNLTNLTLRKLDLTKVESLGLNFDLITSTGVLHHLPSPDEGLLSLKNVLRPDGIMNLMVYGTSLRLGVYMMQEVFRLLKFEQTKADVDIVRATVNSLDPEHVLRRYMKIAYDLKHDGGIVDTFLHPQDRAYSVKEIFEFTRRAGLEFLNWADPVEYSLKNSVPEAHPIWQKINNSHISQEEKYHINDLLVQNRGTHRWFCGHPDYVKKSQIDFDGKEILDYIVIYHRTTKVVTPIDSIKNYAEFSRTNFGDEYKFKISSDLIHVIEKMNGKTSIGNAISSMKLDHKNEVDLVNKLRTEIKSLYEHGHIYVLLPEEK